MTELTRAEADALDELTREYIDERRAQPDPTREQWQATVAKWKGRVNIGGLLTYGASRGWY
jgi:hypothetical protein